MAARKTRQPPAASSGDDSAGAAPASQADSSEAVRLRLLPAALLFGLWFVALVTLALQSADPVTLNRDQIRQADIVVEATIENIEAGRCRIEQTWPAGPFDETITVGGLADLAVSAGQTWLLPLARQEHGNRFHIVKSSPPLSAPLIYPATDESRRQLAAILAGETM